MREKGGGGYFWGSCVDGGLLMVEAEVRRRCFGGDLVGTREEIGLGK
jgi:hypothetical protein